MKITEIFRSILDTLCEKKFTGHFKVTIYHAGMKNVEIAGFKSNTVSCPYDFSCELQSKINEICYKIVSENLTDDNFTFEINGQIVYTYKYGEEND